MAEFIVSGHALERALDMRIEGHEISAAMMRPRDTYWSNSANSEWRTHGRVTACVRYCDDGTPIVTTFMWAKPSGWAADAEYGTYNGRDNNNNLDGVRRVRRAKKRNRR
jgi:hypothetical protein